MDAVIERSWPLPLLASEAPTFVAGFLGIFNGQPTAINLDALPPFGTTIEREV